MPLAGEQFRPKLCDSGSTATRDLARRRLLLGASVVDEPLLVQLTTEARRPGWKWTTKMVTDDS